MISATTFYTIIAMASMTYLARIGGFMLMRNRALSPRAMAVMQAAPGCVLISLIAPNFMTGNMADLAALGITAAVAVRLPMLPTVFIGMATAAILRSFIG